MRRRARSLGESWTNNADSVRMWLRRGSYVSGDDIIEGLSQITARGEF
jgi:hypothetical protein